MGTLKVSRYLSKQLAGPLVFFEGAFSRNDLNFSSIYLTQGRTGSKIRARAISLRKGPEPQSRFAGIPEQFLWVILHQTGTKKKII